jgi:hypothetical protein
VCRIEAIYPSERESSFSGAFAFRHAFGPKLWVSEFFRGTGLYEKRASFWSMGYRELVLFFGKKSKVSHEG